MKASVGKPSLKTFNIQKRPFRPVGKTNRLNCLLPPTSRESGNPVSGRAKHVTFPLPPCRKRTSSPLTCERHTGETGIRYPHPEDYRSRRGWGGGVAADWLEPERRLEGLGFRLSG